VCVDPDPSPLLGLIKRWIPGTRLSQTAGSDMTFTLPATSTSGFQEMFAELERRKQELDVQSYGISDPQLQEVGL